MTRTILFEAYNLDYGIMLNIAVPYSEHNLAALRALPNIRNLRIFYGWDLAS